MMLCTIGHIELWKRMTTLLLSNSHETQQFLKSRFLLPQFYGSCCTVPDNLDILLTVYLADPPPALHCSHLPVQ